MKSIPSSRIQKIVAISAIALIITLIFGIAVSGFSSDNTEPPIEENPPTEEENPPIEQTTPPPIQEPPKVVYKNYLTGLAIAEEKYQAKPYVYVFSSTAPLYSISSADMVIEIPTEKYDTRLLVYTSDSLEKEKIGAIAPTRDYISSLTLAFGGILVANGNDDIVEYDSLVASTPLDLSKNSGYYFVENAKHFYTTGSLISSLTKEERIDVSAVKKPTLPFTFSEDGSTASGKAVANKITVPYEKAGASSLIYDSSIGKYRLFKTNSSAIDMLNGEYCSFDNVFVLFADTVTYEKSDGVETVVDTCGGGKGYYATGGRLCEIRWYCNDVGELIFENLTSQKLIVNPGTSYIGFYKSSDSTAVSFE